VEAAVPTEVLYAISDKENIAVEYYDLPADWLGVYAHLWDMCRPVIGLSRRILGDERLERCVIAHELGHHFTTTGWVVAANSPSAGYHVCRAERLANDYAVDLLVPAEAFLDGARRGYTMDELADMFYVVPQFIQYSAVKAYRCGFRSKNVRNLCRKLLQ